MTNLTLHQQMQLRSLTLIAPRLPDNELRQALVELYTATKVRDAMYRAMISADRHDLLDKCLEADGGQA